MTPSLPRTTLAAAASLYSTLAYWAGGMPGVDAGELIRKLLAELQPDSPAATIEAAIAHAVEQFNAFDSDAARLRHAGHAAALLKTSMGSEVSRKVLSALWSIAGADMHISKFERQFIMETAAYFGDDASVAYVSPRTIYSCPDGSAEEHVGKPQLSRETSAPTEPTGAPQSAASPARFRTQFVSEDDMFMAADAANRSEVMPPGAPPAEVVEEADVEVTQFISKADMFMAADAAMNSEPQAAPPAEATQFISKEDMFRAADAAVLPDVSPPPLVDVPRVPSPVELTEPPPLLDPNPAPFLLAERDDVVTVGDIPGPIEPQVVIAAAQEPGDSGQFGLSRAVLLEHFEECTRAVDEFVAPNSTLADRVTGPTKAWTRHIEFLALDRGRVCNTIAWPRLEDGSASRSTRLAAALALLVLGGEDELWDELRGGGRRLDSAGRAAILEAMEFHNTRERLGAKLVRYGTDERSRAEWRQLSARLLLDPGPERLAELLASEEPADLGLGLQLLCVHQQRARFGSVVERCMFASEVEVQVPALIAGLVLERPAAAIICKQMLRSRGASPELLLLHAVTANAKDFERLLAWAAQSDIDAHVLWSLGYSGRRGGIEACLRGLLDSRAEYVDAAFAGFRASTGFAGEAQDAGDWWREHQSRFEPRHRYMRGQAASALGAKEALRRADARAWDALRLELLVRSRGALVLPRVAMPERLVALVDSLNVSLDWVCCPPPA
jgi:hypothetical protein